VVKGTAEVLVNDDARIVLENESSIHSLANPSKIYLGEDDIVRFDDLYKRP